MVNRVSSYFPTERLICDEACRNQNFIVNKYTNFKRIKGKTNFSDQFRNVLISYKFIGYNLNMMQQTACLTNNPTSVRNVDRFIAC